MNQGDFFRPDWWTKQQIVQLLSSMLEDSIQKIAGKSEKSASFAEELAWLYSDEPAAFSAKNCATAAGYCIEEVRYQISKELSPEKRARLKAIDGGFYSPCISQYKKPLEKVAV